MTLFRRCFDKRLLAFWRGRSSSSSRFLTTPPHFALAQSQARELLDFSTSPKVTGISRGDARRMSSSVSARHNNTMTITIFCFLQIPATSCAAAGNFNCIFGRPCRSFVETRRHVGYFSSRHHEPDDEQNRRRLHRRARRRRNQSRRIISRRTSHAGCGTPPPEAPP